AGTGANAVADAFTDTRPAGADADADTRSGAALAHPRACANTGARAAAATPPGAAATTGARAAPATAAAAAVAADRHRRRARGPRAGKMSVGRLRSQDGHRDVARAGRREPQVLERGA